MYSRLNKGGKKSSLDSFSFEYKNNSCNFIQEQLHLKLWYMYIALCMMREIIRTYLYSAIVHDSHPFSVFQLYAPVHPIEAFWIQVRVAQPAGRKVFFVTKRKKSTLLAMKIILNIRNNTAIEENTFKILKGLCLSCESSKLKIEICIHIFWTIS